METSARRPGRFYGWTALGAASLVYFFYNGAVAMSSGVFLPPICKEFGWSRGAISGAFGAGGVVMLLMGPLAGWFIGRFGPRKAIIFGNSVCAAGMVVAAFASSLWHFYVAYAVLIGLGAGLGGILAACTVTSNWFLRKIPLAMGLVLAAGGAGGLVLIPLISFAIRALGWRFAYLAVAAAVFAVEAVLAGSLVRNRPEDLGQLPDGEPALGGEPGWADASAASADFTVREAVATRALWLMILVLNTTVFAMAMFMTHQIAFLTDLGITPEVAASTVGAYAALNTLGMLLVGALSLKVSLKRLAVAAAFLIFLSMLVAASARSLPTALLYTVLLAVGTGGVMVGVQSLIPIFFGRTHYARIGGFTMPFGFVGAGAGSILPGLLFDATKSYTVPFLIAVAVAALGCLGMGLIRPPVHPSLKVSLVPNAPLGGSAVLPGVD